MLPRSERLETLERPAYLIDVYRVFPRTLFIVATFLIYKVGYWYMYIIPAPERTAEVSAFVAVAAGAWVKLMDYYMQRGVDWSKSMQISGNETRSPTVPNLQVVSETVTTEVTKG